MRGVAQTRGSLDEVRGRRKNRGTAPSLPRGEWGGVSPGPDSAGGDTPAAANGNVGG